MPRKSRRKIVGKWFEQEQEHREREVRRLMQELRAAWRRRRVVPTEPTSSDDEQRTND